jgi:SAM-dependent MidA family methyltransferase
MGLEARLSRLLIQNAGQEQGKRIKDAALKLIDSGPQGMGIKFQFMAVTNATVAPYPFSSP